MSALPAKGLILEFKKYRKCIVSNNGLGCHERESWDKAIDNAYIDSRLSKLRREKNIYIRKEYTMRMSYVEMFLS